MCHAISHLHSRCGHAKAPTSVYPCDIGYDALVGCRAQQLTRQTVIVSSPSFCVRCYREEEDSICEAFGEEKDSVQANINTAMEDMQTENDEHAAKLSLCGDENATMLEIRRHTNSVAALNEFIDECRADLIELAKEKKDELRKFRDEQGVCKLKDRLPPFEILRSLPQGVCSFATLTQSSDLKKIS